MVVWISDTGIGIPSEAMPRLFEKFFRVENEETGALAAPASGLPW